MQIKGSAGDFFFFVSYLFWILLEFRTRKEIKEIDERRTYNMPQRNFRNEHFKK